MTHIKAFGINVSKFIFLVIYIFVFFGCKTIKQDVIKHNYATVGLNGGEIFYNDSLDVSIDFHESTIFKDLSKIKKYKLKKELKGMSELSADNLFAICYPENNPDVITYYFFEKAKDLHDTLTHEKQLKVDSTNKIVVFEKQKEVKKIICVTRSLADSVNVLKIARNRIESVSLDSSSLKKMSAAKIFNYYANTKANFLQAREKLKKYPVKNNHERTGSLMMTINSFMANNKEYDSLITNYEKERYQINKKDQILSSTESIKDEEVFKAISELAKSNQILILNEDHFYPKHRLFAMELLDILKQNGFTYLSIEAFTPNKDGNTNIMPNRENGFYTRESYFGHFLRRANAMGFSILGHESYDSSTNREEGQAKNIMKILEANPKAKIFLYVGHGHLEKESKKRMMASYLKEYSKLDPITINQAKIMTSTKEKLVLIPKSVFVNDTVIKSSADYFLINNLEANLTSIYKDKIFKTVFLKNREFRNFRKEELLLEIYNEDEYEKTKSADLLIPISTSLIKPKGDKVEFSLPAGKYYVVVKSANNQRFKFDNFEVK